MSPTATTARCPSTRSPRRDAVAQHSYDRRHRKFSALGSREPRGKSAYVTNTNAGTLTQYTILPTGRLVAKTPASSPRAHLRAAGSRSAPTERALTSPTSSSTVSQYTVAANGTLSPKTPATVATGTNPLAVVLEL